MSSTKRSLGLSLSTVLLALSSLFADISTEMLYPILPIFLTQVLRASPELVGLVEGVAQAVQNVAQGLAGWLSDRLERRKPLAIAGYSIAAISKSLIGLSTSWVGALCARSLERMATGTRSAPRDALVAASVEDADRGKAFGLEGLGDNLGAFLGPLVAVLLLRSFQVRLQTLFFVALVPGSLAALTVVFVREKRSPRAAKAELDADVARLPKDYWKAVFATSLFGMGNSSNSFLILRTNAIGASLTTTIFIYASFNLVAALASYPAGHLSDKLGRKSVLLASLVVFFVVYAGFGLTSNVAVIGVLFALYGIHQGSFRAVGKALATDFAPDALRASALGWYTAIIGLAGLFASVVGGQLWSRIGPRATFLYGAGAAAAGSIALMILVRPRRAS